LPIDGAPSCRVLLRHLNIRSLRRPLIGEVAMRATLLVRHSVASYDDWQPVFDGHEASRRRHGATGPGVERSEQLVG